MSIVKAGQKIGQKICQGAVKRSWPFYSRMFISIQGYSYKINSCRSTITKLPKSRSYSSLLSYLQKNVIEKTRGGAYLAPSPKSVGVNLKFDEPSFKIGYLNI